MNVEPALAEMLREHLNGRKSGRVFQTCNGTPLSKDKVRRKLVWVLDKSGLKHGGLHAFRHGRVSVLQENGVPGDLVKVDWAFQLANDIPLRHYKGCNGNDDEWRKKTREKGE